VRDMRSIGEGLHGFRHNLAGISAPRGEYYDASRRLVALSFLAAFGQDSIGATAGAGAFRGSEV
jgi:hypothetical protein